MLEKLSGKEKYGLAGILMVSVLIAFGAGAAVSGNGSPTGAFTGDTGELSEAQIQQKVQNLMDRQTEQQRQQLREVANNSENLTMEDLSINSQVEDVSESQFDSLYRVNVSVTGEVPQQLGDGTRSLDQTQTMYISSDGSYLFQEPTDLEQPQQSQTQSRQR